jgi:ankyrin repeat protein
MSWSQDVVVSILFPYLLPCFPIFKNECWLKEDIRSVLEELLMFYCSVSVKKIQELLETFVKRILSISSSYNRNLNDDLYFLADIENRCSYKIFRECKSSVYSLYMCCFFIKHKLFHENEYALQWTSYYGHKDTVALLLEYKANIHAYGDEALRLASEEGHKDTVALLLEHKANIHECGDKPLRLASKEGHKDTVALLLEHKANIRACGDEPLRLASENGHKDTVALLLEHKANIHAWRDGPLWLASEKGHKDIVALLLEHKSDVHALNHHSLRMASEKGHKDIVALLLKHKAHL